MPQPLIEATVVQHSLNSLNLHKGQNPGLLHPAVLKAITPLVAQPLADLLGLSLFVPHGLLLRLLRCRLRGT